MAKDETSVAISDIDMALVNEIRLAEELTRKEVVHLAIKMFYGQWIEEPA